MDLSVQLSSDTSRRGVLLCLLAMLVFAGQDAITKVLVQDLAVSQLLMVRYWVFAVFALGYAHYRGGLAKAVCSGQPRLQLLRSLLAVGEIALFNLSLRYLALAEAHALLAAFPLLAIALAGPVLGERVGWQRWLAVAVGFIGTLIILRPGLGVFKPEALIALTAAFAFAIYNLLTRRVSRTDSFTTSTLYMALVGSVVATSFGLSSWRPPAPEQWYMLGIISVTGILGHLLLVKALECTSASTLQPFNYSLLVFATLFGVAFFGEFPDTGTLLGASVVILSGLYAMSLRRG
ncbi:DMT family transporter [Marinobacterium rhizophilum]|uniref:DMT family transporter n=1 Tax=Marinobacterium rhizophilum TaxID=420402 RepID=A0ABY5HMM8_9GAMM|nr:DMT family transporter [Marinobacterium rhizophilum]UTW13057.1 DMT family transporter [Marinobacterium rhizophilum]